MAPRTILVVDPDPSFGSLLTLVLEEEGYKVTPVESLKDATELLSRSAFDALITEAFDQRDHFDFNPDFLERYCSVAPDIPLILFSTYVYGGTARAGKFGLADVIPKPFDIDDLLRKLDKVVRRD
ncbi:MAG: response regulator [Chloroflexi bacterium]|nr:response regulator [Chloroflexota bacterium]